MNKTLKPVLIVGAGPSGLTMALILSQHGINVKIIDKHPQPISTSNALAVHPRTLEVWQKIEVIDQALAQGKPIHAANIYQASDKLARINFTGLPSEYSFILSLPQSQTEQILSEKLAEYNVHIERGSECTQVELLKDTVKVNINGNIEQYDWVIGCDGGRSTVREQLQIPFTGETLPEQFIMCDVILNTQLADDEMHAFLSEGGPLAIIPAGKTVTRLIAEISNDPIKDQIEEPNEQQFVTLIQQRCNALIEIKKSIWSSKFHIQRRLAKDYVKGRCILVGDAAHLHSPVGGQGMNTGIQDAFDAAHKLVRIINKNANPNILSQYHDKRRKVGERILQRTTLGTKLISMSSSWAQTLRNQTIKLANHSEFIRKKAARIITDLDSRET